MTEYTIAAIPTLYRGRMYRSRLEARWAAFFDRLGWTYEYEPFDLGKWSPDFLLTDLDVLVEVKPNRKAHWDQETANKMAAAAAGRWMLLTLVAPELHGIAVDCGWIIDLSGETHHALIGWRPDNDKPRFSATFPVPAPDALRERVPEARILFPPAGYTPQGFTWDFYGDYVMKLWADACNAVQWEPGQ